MEWMTLAQAAQAAGVSYFTMRDWVVVRKIIPHKRIGKRLIRINKSDVEEMIFGVKTKTNTDD
jgi:excisionase family DNA binding protein|tara:strand:+ start:395 stop:583 length:189 start_codon:yes stop_codon:yes gene_type:complete